MNDHTKRAVIDGLLARVDALRAGKDFDNMIWAATASRLAGSGPLYYDDAEAVDLARSGNAVGVESWGVNVTIEVRPPVVGPTSCNCGRKARPLVGWEYCPPPKRVIILQEVRVKSCPACKPSGGADL